MNDLLTSFGFSALREQLPALLADARLSQPSYDAFLVTALTVEHQARETRSLERRRHEAHLPMHKTLAMFDFTYQLGISEAQVRDLAALHFLETATNVLFLGPPGVGKTHLALALGEAALQAGKDVLFTTLRGLAAEMDTAQRQGKQAQLLRKWRHPALVIIDEVGYTHLSAGQAQALFDLVHARYEHGSIVLTSNTSFTEWGAILGDEVLTTAILDRLVHHAEILTITGPSYRMKERRQHVVTTSKSLKKRS